MSVASSALNNTESHMSYTADGKIVTVIYINKGVVVDTFDSTKEMVQHYIAEMSLGGAWSSAEHLTALHETKVLLDRVIAATVKEYAAKQE